MRVGRSANSSPPPTASEPRATGPPSYQPSTTTLHQTRPPVRPELPIRLPLQGQRPAFIPAQRNALGPNQAHPGGLKARFIKNTSRLPRRHPVPKFLSSANHPPRYSALAIRGECTPLRSLDFSLSRKRQAPQSVCHSRANGPHSYQPSATRWVPITRTRAG